MGGMFTINLMAGANGIATYPHYQAKGCERGFPIAEDRLVNDQVLALWRQQFTGPQQVGATATLRDSNSCLPLNGCLLYKYLMLGTMTEHSKIGHGKYKTQCQI